MLYFVYEFNNNNNNYDDCQLPIKIHNNNDDCQLVSDVGRRRLRSSDISTCVVPRTHTGFGDRAFQVAGPRLWNSLSASLRQSDTTVGQFKKLLKTHLFSWDCGALVTVAFTAPCLNISTTTTTTLTLNCLVFEKIAFFALILLYNNYFSLKIRL